MRSGARVSIITVNYNQVALTCALIESLKKVSYPDVEIVVVDNGSPEDATPTITKRYPEVKFIRSEQNLGFAGGNNLGIQESTGKYFLFLNNDTEVDPGFLEPLVELFETNPTAGAASSKLIYFNSDNIIQYAGSTALNPFTGRNKRIGYMEKDFGQHDTLRETDLAHGAAMMVPKSVIEKAGLMPEFFFLYYEEVDWCERIKKAGYKIYVVPASKVYHKESMSVGKKSTLKTYYMTRNRVLFMRRNTSGFTKASWLVFFLAVTLPKNFATYLLKRDIAHLKAFSKALIWNMTHLSNGEKKLRLFA
jgi:GT2 family glycosyltransferase